MIKWYKRLYQIAEDERDSELEIPEIFDRLHNHFDTQTDEFFEGFKTARNPYIFLNRGFSSFTIKQTTKLRGLEDSILFRLPTLVEGEVIDLGEKRQIKLVSEIPVKWALAPIPILLVLYSAPTYIVFLSALFIIGIYIWFRQSAKLDLVDVDIELYRCLKK